MITKYYKKKNLSFHSSFLFAFIFLLFSCAHNKPVIDEKPQQLVTQQNNEVTMIAVGDNLIHIELINNAKTGNDEFNFLPYYKNVRPLIETADIAFINQETLIAGSEFVYSGYPAFNGPAALGDAIAGLGFDVVNHATNHSMDKGEKAVYKVIEYWDKRPEILMLGLNRSADDRNEKTITTKNIIEKNNIRFGFLSYTYGLNGISLPKDKPWLVSLIDTEVMAREIDALRPLCDILIVSMHWGNEYEHKPSKRQLELAEFLSAHNVDLVIGHHPHVVQPIKTFNRGDGKTTLVFFSLGNFISAQVQNYTLLGGMMRVRFIKDSAGVYIDNAEFLPLVTHYDRGYKNFSVYTLDNYSEEKSKTHGSRSEKNDVSTAYFNRTITEVFGGNLSINAKE
ncbi:capsular polysaccharide biosynthesis protein [Spirochaetia bacterium]|nr:capsular polysaccharide biosynthesis protein [Spirochaetia bacterium]